jgi:hypothetical protein
MGLFTDIKNMKDTVRAGAAQSANPMVGAPGVVTAAELEPIAGVSLELYAQLAKTVGETVKIDPANPSTVLI